MSEKIKKYIIFAAFIIVLLLLSLSHFFSKDLLWPSSGENRYFSGIIFQNPTGIEDLIVTRSVERENNEYLIKYNYNFSYKGEDSTARIMGLPVRQIYFDEDTNPVHSVAKLRGDYEKINNTLFSTKFKLKDYYKKSGKDNYIPLTTIRIPLVEREGSYSFDAYYRPESLLFSGGRIVERTSIFLTNARVSDFKESTKITDSIKEAFNDSGFYVNKLELINDKLVTRINIVNTCATIGFLFSMIFLIAMIWFNKANHFYYLIPMLAIIPTFYRFLGKGTSNLGILLIYPILGFLAAFSSKLISKDHVEVESKDLKQSLAFALAFYAFCILFFIIPRAFI